MKATIVVLLVFICTTAFARDVYVKSYVRKDGGFVQEHYRTSPDGNVYNNYSTKGNINPYTGKAGTVEPYSIPQTLPKLPAPPITPVVAPSSHYYAMKQDGTYGYEPALSEEDVRQGITMKPLVMMRYVGFRNGNYVLLVLDPNNENVTTRITCQAPCNFAKMQLMAGTDVLKTETIHVAPNSVMGGMFIDAMAGQLQSYDQAQNMPQFNATQSPTPTTPLTDQVGVQSGERTQQNVTTDSTLQQTSFDCSKARSIPEYLICHDPELAGADRDLSIVFQQAKNAVVDKTAFSERTRKLWNYREKNCRDKTCLASWYVYQKNVLTKIAQTGDVNAN